MFQPSKTLQAWTLLVQDAGPGTAKAAKALEESVSRELRDAWAAGQLIPNTWVQVRALGKAFHENEPEFDETRKYIPPQPIDFPLEPIHASNADRYSAHISRKDSLERACAARPDHVYPPAIKSPIDSLELPSKEPLELAKPVTPAPEIKMVKGENPGLIAEGKPIPPFYRGESRMVNAQLVRERMKALANREGISRNLLILSVMKFKTSVALGNILSAKHDTIETCFGQYLAEVLGQDILIP